MAHLEAEAEAVMSAMDQMPLQVLAAEAAEEEWLQLETLLLVLVEALENISRPLSDQIFQARFLSMLVLAAAARPLVLADTLEAAEALEKYL